MSCSCEPANNSKVRTVATPCVLSSCQGDDITKTLQVSEQICAPGNDAGGSGGESQTSSAAEETTTATETASETATETASETATETATESATETATATETEDNAEETSTAVGGPETVYVTVCDSSATKAPVVPAPTGNTTAPTQAPPTFTGAAGKVGATLGSVAMAALAALAL